MGEAKMLEYKIRMYMRIFPTKWKKVMYKSLSSVNHLDFDRFIYRNGHKLYTATSKEIRELYKKERGQYIMWSKLKQ